MTFQSSTGLIVGFCLLCSGISGQEFISNCEKGQTFFNVTEDQKKGDIVLSFDNSTLLTLGKCKDYLLEGHNLILQVNPLEDCSWIFSKCDVVCNGTSQTFISIRSTENLFPPEINDTIEITFRESAAIGSELHDFDQDVKFKDCKDSAPENVVYVILNYTDMFYFQSRSHLKLKKNLDYETIKQYIIPIEVFHDGDTVNTTFIINVVDVDDMDPVFVGGPYHLNVTEKNTSYVNVSLSTQPPIHATDRDTGEGRQNVTYSIIRGNTEGKFDICSTDGSIVVRSELDYDQTPAFTLVLKATQANNDKRTATSTLSVTVLDINNHLPYFIQKQYDIEIDEHQSDGSYVLQVTAIDKDAGKYANTHYELLSGMDVFQIDQELGLITVKNAFKLDRETKKHIIFQVEAIDVNLNATGGNTSVTVTLRDRNDNSPTFAENAYSFRVDQNRTNEIVGVVNATDRDEGDNANIKYRVIPDGIVGINATSGELQLKKALYASLDVRVEACDSPLPTSARRCNQVDVHLWLHNDSSVVGGIENFTIPENSAIGTIVGNLENLKSASVHLEEENENFDLSRDGLIRTKTILDRENITYYTFQVEIVGQVTSTVTVNVEVTDVNDNAPKFVSESYFFGFPNRDVSLKVGSVNATDEDVGENSRISYSLQTNVDSKYFVIDNKTGEITVSSKKIPNDTWILQLVVIAKNKGLPSLQSVCNVYVSRVSIDGEKVKLSTPLTKAELEKQSEQLESSIGKLLGFTIASDILVAHNLNEVKSYMMLTATYINGSQVPAQQLQRSIISHLNEIQALFSQPLVSKMTADDSLKAPEIALIVIASLMFVITTVAIIVLSRKWKKKKTGDRIEDILTRSSSLYESQELKIKLDDETSDYNGSLNTQELESMENDRVVVNGAAFDNQTYQTYEEETSVKTAPTEAFNEAISSLNDLSELLEEEEPNAPKPDYESSDNDKNTSDNSKTVPSYSQSNKYDNIDGNFMRNEDGMMSFPEQQEGENDSENGERMFESISGGGQKYNSDHLTENEPDVDYNIKQTRFSAQVFDIENNAVQELKDKKASKENTDNSIDEKEETGEVESRESQGSDADELPDVDYNIKKPRFSTQVIDITNDLVVELKPDTTTENAADDKENDIDDDEPNFVTDFGDEHDKVDEEINSPMDFLKVEDKDSMPSARTFDFDEETTAL